MTRGSDGRTVAVTFDDAYLSVFELARPILDEVGFPATVFVPTDYPGSPAQPMAWDGIDKWLSGPYERELRPMSWEQLGVLAETGWEIGSHSCSHPRLPSLTDEDLARELIESRSVVAASRPAAAASDRTRQTSDGGGRARRGLRSGGHIAGRLARTQAAGVAGIGIYHVDDERRFRIKVSAAVRWLRGTRLWPS